MLLDRTKLELLMPVAGCCPGQIIGGQGDSDWLHLISIDISAVLELEDRRYHYLSLFVHCTRSVIS